MHDISVNIQLERVFEINMKRALFWFRNDLRLSDNVALVKSMDECDEVIPVYCFDPRHFQMQPWGDTKSGSFRSSFLLQSVKDLKANIHDRGGQLIIRIGKPEEVLISLATALEATSIYCSKEITSEEVQVEDQLEKALWRMRKSFFAISQSTLYHLEDLPWPIGHLPNVFTAFRKDVEKEMKVRKTIARPLSVHKTHVWPGELPTLMDLGVNELVVDTRTVFPLEGGEGAGSKRLDFYLWDTELITNYKQTRNGMIGTDYSSKLSPYLALGCISPRTVYEEVKNFEGERVANESTYWLIFELMWRDYFKFVAKKSGNAIFQLGGIKNEPVYGVGRQEAFASWCNGHTPEPFVNANMVELNETGFMSNRGRQITASYLVNDLKVDWILGASYFESKLIDYDPCSNWCNWCYIAGVGNDPRKDRYFNPKTQAQKYDPKGAYVRLWLGN